MIALLITLLMILFLVIFFVLGVGFNSLSRVVIDLGVLNLQLILLDRLSELQEALSEGVGGELYLFLKIKPCINGRFFGIFP